MPSNKCRRHLRRDCTVCKPTSPDAHSTDTNDYLTSPISPLWVTTYDSGSSCSSDSSSQDSGSSSCGGGGGE